MYKEGAVAVIIPVYNEEEVVRDVIFDLRNKRENDIIIAINDGSSDNSISVLTQIENIYVLNHELNLG